ncbi:MAG: hypothetical protein QM697_12090 [Lachnospiraceae bacterium]
MKNILRGLYSGAIIPWERNEPDSEKRREILQKLEDEEQYFMEKCHWTIASGFRHYQACTWSFPP